MARLAESLGISLPAPLHDGRFPTTCAKLTSTFHSACIMGRRITRMQMTLTANGRKCPDIVYEILTRMHYRFTRPDKGHRRYR